MKKAPEHDVFRGLCGIPAITYFRAVEHYHRPCELNDRVRNGNVCCLAGIVTGKEQACQPNGIRLPVSSDNSRVD